MTLEDLSLDLRDFPKDSQDLHIIEEALRLRGESMKQFAQEQFETALATNVEALRKMRDFSSFSHTEFRALLVGLLIKYLVVFYAADVQYEMLGGKHGAYYCKHKAVCHFVRRSKLSRRPLTEHRCQYRT